MCFVKCKENKSEPKKEDLKSIPYLGLLFIFSYWGGVMFQNNFLNMFGESPSPYLELFFQLNDILILPFSVICFVGKLVYEMGRRNMVLYIFEKNVEVPVDKT